MLRTIPDEAAAHANCDGDSHNNWEHLIHAPPAHIVRLSSTLIRSFAGSAAHGAFHAISTRTRSSPPPELSTITAFGQFRVACQIERNGDRAAPAEWHHESIDPAWVNRHAVTEARMLTRCEASRLGLLVRYAVRLAWC